MAERYRITYTKTDALRYVSHLDLQKIWIRTLLRAGIQLVYTEGFHPAPKISPGWPLALGWAGYGEMIDLWFDISGWTPSSAAQTETELIERINRNSPPGLKVTELKQIPLYDPALTTVIESAVYYAEFLSPVPPNQLNEQMAALLSRPAIERKRRNKLYDLRPLIEDYRVRSEAGNSTVLEIRMAARDSAMGRPDEVMDELGYDINTIRFSRVKLLLKQNQSLF